MSDTLHPCVRPGRTDKHCRTGCLLDISPQPYHPNKSLTRANRWAVDATFTTAQNVSVDHGRPDIVVAHAALESVVWNVYFGPLKLGRLLEKQMRIEDAFGRLKRHL